MEPPEVLKLPVELADNKIPSLVELDPLARIDPEPAFRVKLVVVAIPGTPTPLA
jgi:hypothetical protein